MSAILRDLGATPEEIRAIAVVFGARARDGNLKDGQKLRVLLSPVRGTERLQPVRVMLVGDLGIEAVVALLDMGRYVNVDLAKPETASAQHDFQTGRALPHERDEIERVIHSYVRP